MNEVRRIAIKATGAWVAADVSDLLGANAGGVGGNPAILAFASKLVPTDRTDITYATSFPAATITKIILVQIMLAMMGKP